MAERTDTCILRVESFRFPQDHVNIPRPVLQAIYRVGMLGGWRPCGTIAPPTWPDSLDESLWSGNYVNPFGQAIRDEDAAALLAGIAAMFPDIPEPREGAEESGNVLEFLSAHKDALLRVLELLEFGSIVITSPR